MQRDIREGKAGHLITISDLAREVGASTSSVSRRVAKFEQLGLLKVRIEGRRKLVDRDSYTAADRAVTDGVKRMNARSGKRRPDINEGEIGGLALAEEARAAARNAALAEVRLLVPCDGFVSADDIEAAIARAENNLAEGIQEMRDMLAATPDAGELDNVAGDDPAGEEPLVRGGP